MKDFDSWNQLKKEIDLREYELYYKTREVWFCSLGTNVGFEEDGKNAQFERPVLVVKKFNKQIFWAVPLTTKLKPDNKHYITYKHGDMQYAAIVSQLRVLDSKRLTRKVFSLNRSAYDRIKSAITLELENKTDSEKPESSEPEGHCAPSVSENNLIVNRILKKKRPPVKTKHHKGSFRSDTFTNIAQGASIVKGITDMRLLTTNYSLLTTAPEVPRG